MTRDTHEIVRYRGTAYAVPKLWYTHALAAERLCRAVEVAVLLEVCGDVATGAVCHDPWCECKTHDQWQDAKSIWRAARQGNNRAPVAREVTK